MNNKYGIKSLYEEEIINSINDIFHSLNVKTIIKKSDLKTLEKLINNHAILYKIILKKEIKRKINYVSLKSKREILQFKKKFSLNINKYFLLFAYICIFFIIKKQNENVSIGDKEQNKNYFKDIFILFINLYKSGLLSFHTIFLFFDFYFELIKIYDILNNADIGNKILIINFVKKIIKIANNYNFKDNISKESSKELINKDIHKLFEKIFMLNNNDNITHIKFCLNLLKYEKILDLIKLCFDYYDNCIINNNNKNFIKNNLIKLFSNKFSHNHLNYFYGLSKKYLFSLDESVKNNKNFISLFNGILEFFIEINKNEISNLENNRFYFDKYFIFDSSNKESGIRTSPILFNNLSDLGLTIIFSFNVIKPKLNNITNNKQVILSLNNSEYNSFIFKLLLIDNNLYYYTKNNENKNLILNDIKFNSSYLCFIYYDYSLLYFFINNEYKFFEEKNILKDIKKIYLEIGYSTGDNERFNGLVGPVIVFNSLIKDHFNVFIKMTQILKGKYYLAGENKKNKEQDEEEKFFFSYEEYKGNNNIDMIILNDIRKSLGNEILYINPQVVINNLNINREIKIPDKENYFRDFQTYNNLLNEQNDNNNSQKTIFYLFNANKNIYNNVFKENSLFQFLINCNGYNFIILNIECIYNYLIISKDENSKANNFEIM